MSIFSRIAGIFSSNANAALDRMENPEAMLNQYLRNMEDEISKAQEALVKLTAAKKLTENEYIVASRTAKAREEQAMTALQAGDEGLAQRAMADKLVWQEKADELYTQLHDAIRTCSQFENDLNELRRQYSEMVVKRRSIVARHQFAKASNQIHKTMSRINTGGALSNFERISNRVIQLEAEANARIHLRESVPDIDADIRKLRTNAAVELELDALRAKLKPAQ